MKPIKHRIEYRLTSLDIDHNENVYFLIRELGEVSELAMFRNLYHKNYFTEQQHIFYQLPQFIRFKLINPRLLRTVPVQRYTL